MSLASPPTMSNRAPTPTASRDSVLQGSRNSSTMVRIRFLRGSSRCPQPSAYGSSVLGFPSL